MSDEIWHGDIAGSTRFIRTCTNADATGPCENAVTDIVKNRTISTTGGGVTWHYTFNGTVANTIKGVVLCNINTDIWDSAIRIAASDDNFDTIGSSQSLNVITRKLNEWDPVQGEVVSAPRYDAYLKTDLSYQDYRIALNTTDVSTYSIGRIYLFKNILELTHPSLEDQPADIVTTSIETQGAGGQYIKIPESSRTEIPLNIQRSPNKAEIDELKHQVEMNPSCVYVCDGLANGQILFGSFKFGKRQVFGKVFGPYKINLSGTFFESR